MKNLISILGGILLAAYVVLTALSWGSAYQAERSLWLINHKLAYVVAHNESTPDFTVDHLAKEYRAYIGQHHDMFGQKARIALGNLYALRKNYDQARTEYRKAMGGDAELSAEAEFSIGKTCELENNWEAALPYYKDMIQKYPLTETGFFVPAYLASHDPRVYAYARAFYKRIALEHPKSKLQYNSMRMVTLCDLNLKDWQDAVNTMGELIVKYPTGRALQEGVNTINLLCVTRLHNYDLGISLYEQFIHKHPNHPAVPVIKKMIKDLEFLKKKNLFIKPAPPVAHR